jgi:cellobiose phosphorylase
MAGDIYTAPRHLGRGGWSWYTGAAGWMYRLIVESLLGVHLEGDRLRLTPVAHPDWDTYTIHYRYKTSTYHIRLTRGGRASGLAPDGSILLVDDGAEHDVEIALQERP